MIALHIVLALGFFVSCDEAGNSSGGPGSPYSTDEEYFALGFTAILLVDSTEMLYQLEEGEAYTGFTEESYIDVENFNYTYSNFDFNVVLGLERDNEEDSFIITGTHSATGGTESLDITLYFSGDGFSATYKIDIVFTVTNRGEENEQIFFTVFTINNKSFSNAQLMAIFGE